ncbi:MAG: hypothetical protein ACRCT8_04395 [Lacipirellulaceae bacterium]
MPNTMRWRYGDTNPVMMAPASEGAIEIGDLLYLDDGVANPASLMQDQETLVLNQQAFQDVFLGVAMQASAVGSTAPIRVATTGVFEFDCAPLSFPIGALVGATENTAGTLLERQRVGTAVSVAGAIGRCAKATAAAAPRVLVDVVSTVTRGGPQAPA